MNKLLALVGVATLVLGPKVAAQQISDPYRPTQSDIGGVGLLQMPSGRMAEEGEFSALYYDNDEYRRMALTLQLFPWLESTIRYTDVRTRLYSQSPGFSGDQTYKDRGLDIKVRLLEEDYWLPELSLGLRDIAGTGQFAGEYIAASKRFGPVDFTLGLGFGYIGRTGNIDNPLCEIADRFCERGNELSGEGGEFEIDEWFTGNAAIFGGIEYQTPWDPLALKIEYDGNDYSREPSRTPIEQDSHWNFGLHYRVSDNFNIQVSYERGNTWMFGFNLRTNFNDLSQYKRTPPLMTPGNPKAETFADVDVEELAEVVYQKSGFWVREIKLSDNNKTVYLHGYQSMYMDNHMGVERAAAVLANYLPATVAEYKFVTRIMDMDIAQTTVDANKFKRAYYRADITTRYEDSYKLVEPESNAEDGLFQREHQITWPRLSFRPYLEQSFGGPEAFYMYMLRADGYLRWSPTPDIAVNGVISAEIISNYDEFNYLVENNPTNVPRVRTYVREYATQSDIWLNSLQLTYAKQLDTNLYASVYGGYLERMFGGIGTEWLYREVNSDWALGANINYARQRSYESHLGFRDYDVITGHVTGYLQMDWPKDSMIKVSAGRFLAKDNGVQVQFEKKFESGIIVGAYAAKTNLSAEEFGEGSFNKGFYISIPFDLFQARHTTGRGGIGWAPLTRDGGQMLGRAQHLIGITDAKQRFYTNP